MLNARDMSLTRAEPLSSQRPGLQVLISSILAQDSRPIPNRAGVRVTRDNFYHHSYNLDPSTGGPLPSGVTADIYYIPASLAEYQKFDVVDKDLGIYSSRHRLAVRIEKGSVSFYRTSHPKEENNLRTNRYLRFIAVDPNARALQSERLDLTNRLRERTDRSR